MQALETPAADRHRAIFHSIMPPSTCHQTVMEVENDMLQVHTIAMQRLLVMLHR